MSEYSVAFKHMGMLYVVSFDYEGSTPCNLSIWTDTVPRSLIYSNDGWETDQIINVRPKLIHVANLVCEDYISDNLTPCMWELHK